MQRKTEVNNPIVIDNNEFIDIHKCFELISENIDYGIIVQNIDKDYKVEYINRSALEYLGCKLEEFREKYNNDIFSFIYKDDIERLKENLILASKNKKDFNFETRIINKDGALQWIAGKTRITIYNNKYVAISSFKDITKEKTISNNLRINEERLRVAFSQTKNVIFDYNAKDKSIEFLDENNIYGLNRVVTDIPQSIIKKDLIEPESVDDFMKFFHQVDSGVDNASCTIKAKLPNGNIVWGKISIRSVFDESNRYIKGVGIIQDITSEKEIENKYRKEEIYRSVMLNEALIVYEANVTKNKVIRGVDYGKDEFNIENIKCYEDMILILAEKVVHKEDKKKYLEHYLRNNIISKYHEGIDEINIEYRRLQSNNEYVWVSCTTHILKDPLTNDIVIFTYEKNINDKKIKEISLKYEAERDLLTELYNKKTTQRLINDIISRSNEKTTHAFLIVDLDNFKSINDRYGHIFGDAILSEIGNRLKAMFRRDDIVGRIGGDEFVIFLNNIDSVEICREKANKICDMFREVNKGIELFSPSGTVGVSIYPKDGDNFITLYEKADSALYFAKGLGKDRYFFYDKDIVGEKRKKITNTDEELNTNKKNFRNNVLEYIFKILYHSKDLSIAIESVLKLVINHFNFDRGYIFESTKDNLYINNTFEFCVKDIESQKKELQNIKYEDLEGYEKYFEENNIYISRSSGYNVKNDLEDKKIKLRIQCAMRPKGDFMGFIGFDDYETNRIPTNEEIATIQTVAEILGTFLASKRSEEEAIDALSVLEKVMDNLDTFTYVVNPKNHEIVFVNKRTKEMFEDLEIGDKCYFKLKGFHEPCEDCPIKKLSYDEYYLKTNLFNEKYEVWSEATISYINWINNEGVCLVHYPDISAFVR